VTDHGRRTDRRAPGAGAPDDAGQDRVVIRDKRKIKLSDTNYTKSADAPAGADAPDASEVIEGEIVNGRVEEATVVDAQPRTGSSAEPAGTPEAATTAQPSGTAQPAGTAEEPTAPLGAELESLRAELDERTGDLQRLSAEFANYRKRVDRDRAMVTEQATGHVLTALLPVLDDLDRARDHGDLVGPFGTVAEQLTTTLSKFGLTPFGVKGDRFDPTRHEAVAHLTSAEVTEPTCVDVMRRGYLLGERLLRPALVAVADPE